MNEKQETVLRKVQKFFALARGGTTPEETENAAFKARRLLSEYNSPSTYLSPMLTITSKITPFSIPGTINGGCHPFLTSTPLQVG